MLGAFRITAPNGQRLVISSKKGIALLGLLATAKGGERWRTWLQEKLWGSRESPQAQASLRRELHGLRNMAANSGRSEEHTSELQSLMRISYAVFCLKKTKTNKK